MIEYTLKIELLSDMIFGSGMATPGSVDLEVLHDSYGIPYMKGKTIKGKLREEVRNITRWINNGVEDAEAVARLFGCADRADMDSLLFSNVTIDENVIKIIRQEVKSKESSINSDDILLAFTGVRSHTSIDYETGKARKGSLRRLQTINKGIIFYCTISSRKELAAKDEALLCAATAGLCHLGVNETRGKGLVRCSLIKNGEDITNDGVNALLGKEES